MGRILAAVLVALALVFASDAADAYVLRQTDDGAPVRWPTRDVTYVRDRSFEAIPGAGAALDAAAKGWSTRARLDLAVERDAEALAIGLDGKNGVFRGGWTFRPDQLAVTVVTFDDRTGQVLDADVVLRDDVAFSATPPAKPDGDGERVYDLERILAHELGHSLGLGDELEKTSSVMYLYTRANDASKRIPTADDLAGIRALYKQKQPGEGGGGCRMAARPGAGAWAGALLVAGAVAFVAKRRRIGLALVVAWALGSSASEAAPSPRPRVVSAVTEARGGVFFTRLELDRGGAVVVPGGRVGHLVQIVGHEPTPAVGDEL